MTELTELQARSILVVCGSPAASPAKYRADRVDQGWVFQWIRGTKKVPLGVRSWVVTDSGVVDTVDLGESFSEALARLCPTGALEEGLAL